MATQPASSHRQGSIAARLLADLREPARCIAGPWFDAAFFWGTPVLALLFVYAWLWIAALLPASLETRAVGFLGVTSAILTFAHLIAVAPRAYLNREVFGHHRIKLTLVPVLLLAALLISPVCFVIGATLSVLWDVHHSAMQNFGLARIYDMRAGQSPQQLRWTDMRLNWVLYVGPLAAGASLPFHLSALGEFGQIGWTEIAGLPGVLESELTTIAHLAIAACLVVIGWALLDYARAIRAGYRLPAHKLAMTLSSASVSILAWGFSSPPVALAAINIYHALQYFALVWLKEGKSIQSFLGVTPRKAFDGLLLFCAVFAIGYQFASSANIQWLLAPFIACSLLHFWFDGFVWSVRKKQV